MSQQPACRPSRTGTILVVGCGLIGTSVALASVRGGCTVYLRDLDEGNAAIAESLGAGSTSAPEAVGLVVAAVPPDHIAGVVVEALAAWPDAVVTDVSSVKAAPLSQIESSGADVQRYVGGHPMAGSEQSGPMAASPDLFEGRAWAVTPHPAASPEAVDAVQELARACGASVVPMDPREHDAAVARVSHLPHLMSALTAGQLNGSPGPHLALAGQGLRDVTRVAAGDPELWRQILAANARELSGLLSAVRAEIDALLTGLDGDVATVGGVLSRGVAGTTLIPGKHGVPAPETATVYVHIPDLPGELARLFADAEESGVNVEDVRIDHEFGHPVGVAELGVLVGDADTFVAALTGRGWTAYR